MNNVQNTYCLRIQGSKSTMEVYAENPIRKEVLRHQDLRSAKKITATDILPWYVVRIFIILMQTLRTSKINILVMTICDTADGNL